MEAFLDRLHARVRANPVLQRFTVFTRLLLAIGYIPPALVKVQGERFTGISIDHPVGFFFEAMYRTGMWWQFLGWAQLAASLLLLVPRTATLGALLYLPITINVFLITVSLHFKGTPVVTGLMLLACVYLLCWDYDRIKAAALSVLAGPPRVPIAWSPLELAGYALGTVAALGAVLWTRRFVSTPVMKACLGLILVAGCMVVWAWARTIVTRRAAASGRPPHPA
jgi:hypothetical protein